MIKDLKELFNYRQMIFSMTRKDLRGRYMGSVLGFLWTFVNPLLQLLVYDLVFSFLLRNGMEKFYLYLFAGLVPWMFFSSAVTNGCVAVLSQKSMVKKIYFPREVLPIAYVTSGFVNMLLSFLIIFVVMLIGGIAPGHTMHVSALLCLPLIWIVEYILALGFALITSALTVYFRDLQHILGILTMAWMYACPIVYDISLVADRLGSKLWIYYLNPMAPVINAYHQILYYGEVPDLATLFGAVGMGLFFVIVGYAVFRRLQRGFAEEI